MCLWGWVGGGADEGTADSDVTLTVPRPGAHLPPSCPGLVPQFSLSVPASSQPPLQSTAWWDCSGLGWGRLLGGPKGPLQQEAEGSHTHSLQAPGRTPPPTPSPRAHGHKCSCLHHVTWGGAPALPFEAGSAGAEGGGAPVCGRRSHLSHPPLPTGSLGSWLLTTAQGACRIPAAFPQPLSWLCCLSHSPRPNAPPSALLPPPRSPFSCFAPLVLFLQLGKVPEPQRQAQV